ncbi:MAG: hypothetical protein QW265_00910 [Candidatus Bathyarchaeia archaeon]
MRYGLQKYAKPVREVLLLPVIEYTKRDTELSAEIDLKAERMRMPIRRTDAMIAAITLNRRSMLYTLDLKHFAPLKTFGLKLYPK